MMLPSHDIEIRQAFHHKKLKTQRESLDTLVIDELGLTHGSNRIDIAVLNGSLHGYEIKSSKDTLKRLDHQLNTYIKTLQKITFITAPNHLDELSTRVPQWCGIVMADKGKKGAIHFSRVRNARKNPEVDPIAFAHLLWKTEAQDLLLDLGLEQREVNTTRLNLYKILAEKFTISQLTQCVKEKFKGRKNWRSLSQ